MVIVDKVTSLADLAFRGRTDKRYRHLAVLTATYYGRPDMSWEKAIALLYTVVLSDHCGSCVNIVRDVNFNRELVKDDWIEPPEQLELKPLPRKSKIAPYYNDWLYEDAYRYYQRDNNYNNITNT